MNGRLFDTDVPKRLVVGPARDEHERHADWVAQTMAQATEGHEAMPTQGAFGTRRGEDEAVDDGVQRAIRQGRGGGRGLPGPVRASLERALGADFHAVRVHADGAADRLNQALGARAFTTGQHIFFRRGEYAPGDRGGRALIAHELAHVVQQRGDAGETIQRSLLGSAELKQQWATKAAGTTLMIDHDNWDRDDQGVLWYAVATIDGQASPPGTWIRQDQITIAPVGRGTVGKFGFAHSIAGPGSVANYEVPERQARAAEDTFVSHGPGNLTLGQDSTGNNIVANITATDVTILGRTYQLTDYKDKPIIIPRESTMWQWYKARAISRIDVTGANDPDLTRRVVFGTKNDRYAVYPEKYGFMNRRQVMQERSWKNTYEQRLQARNPLRGTKRGKWTSGPGVNPQDRWDEINEESGLRVKHAPGIIMINQFLRSFEDFVRNYMGGSQGTGVAGGGRARPTFVTAHEIYRMFSGKNRKQILDRTLFGHQGQVQVNVAGKKRQHWYTKDQIARNYRIQYGK
jgi:hypothetical protein